VSLFLASVPDILHTVGKGIIEYIIGITLQIIMIVSRIDPDNFRTSLATLDARVRTFPSFNSAHPTRPVSWIHGLSPFIKDMGSLDNLFSQSSILLTAGTETYKLPSMVLHLTFVLASGILPTDPDWLTEHDFPHSEGNPFTKRVSVHEIVVTALASVLEYWFCLDTKLKSESNLNDLEYLNSLARAHYARLFHLRNRLLLRKSNEDDTPAASENQEGKPSEEDIVAEKVFKIAKFHLSSHQPFFMRRYGGYTRQVDCEFGEAAHKDVVTGPWACINRQQQHTAGDCMNWLRIKRVMAYNAMKYGVAEPRKVTLEPAPIADGDAMAFYVARGTSTQHISYTEHRRSGRPLLGRDPDPSHRHSDGPAFVHSRVGEKNLFKFLNLKSSGGAIPGPEDVTYIRLVTQLTCLGDHQPHGVGPFRLSACPQEMATLRSRIPQDQKVEQFNFVLVEYVEEGSSDDDDDDRTLVYNTEVAMVIAIINYEHKHSPLSNKTDTRIIIAWMRDGDRTRASMHSPYPYPVKQLIVIPVGEGGAERGGNQFMLDIIEPGQIRAPVFMIKELVARDDVSIAFPNGRITSYEEFAAARFFYISHARMTASYDLTTAMLRRTYPKTFFTVDYITRLQRSLEMPLPKKVKRRTFGKLKL
jgi:hypothetical protein